MIEVPEFLLEMSGQMNSQPNRCTAHPFWQVRCKQYVVTAEDYSVHHWELVCEDGVFYRSDLDEDPHQALIENYDEFSSDWISSNGEDFYMFDIDYDSLPKGVYKVFMQEVEEVVTTHFTEADANWFIKRKQHDYPKLYTYVESAYWSPQFKQLQDWIKSLTAEAKA